MLQQDNNKLIFLGGLESSLWLNNGKKLSRNFRQGYRVYDSRGLANTLPSSSIGGLGGNSGLYLVIEVDNEFSNSRR